MTDQVTPGTALLVVVALLVVILGVYRRWP